MKHLHKYETIRYVWVSLYLKNEIHITLRKGKKIKVIIDKAKNQLVMGIHLNVQKLQRSLIGCAVNALLTYALCSVMQAPSLQLNNVFLQF